MNKELENIDKLIKKTTEEITTFKNKEKDLLEQQSTLEKEHKDTNQRLLDAVKDMNAQIESLEKKREEISQPIYDKINSIESKQCDMRHTINNGESKSRQLEKMNKIKTILEKIEDGYYITIADKWGNSTKLGMFDRNNYRPDGWNIIDIFIKGTSVYCQSDIAKNPRRLFNLLTEYRWSITLADSLKPIATSGGRVIECTKCGLKRAVQSKVCPVCRNESGKKPIEYTCNTCGHVVDCSSDDKHKFSDEPETVVVRTD